MRSVKAACRLKYASHSQYLNLKEPLPTPNLGASTPITGNEAALVAVLNPAGSAISYTVLMGGSSYETFRALAVDSSGLIYAVGETASSSYPAPGGGTINTGIVSGAHTDIVLVKLNPALGGASSLVHTSVFGGSANDIATRVALDESVSPPQVWVTGYTNSTNLPTTGTNQLSSHGAGRSDYDSFILKHNMTTSGTGGLSYSTYYGGTGDDFGFGIEVGSDGKDVFVTGNTASSDLPVSANALQGVYGGNQDGYLARVKAPIGTNNYTLTYGTYLGGSKSDDMRILAVLRPSLSVYLAGVSYSQDFPISSAVLGTNLAGGSDSVVSRFNFLKLGVITQPTTTVVNAAISPTVAVSVQNLDGSTYPSYTGSVAAQIAPNTGAPGAVLGGTTSQAVAGGVASFGGISLNKTGIGYGLKFSTLNNLLDPVSSTSFDVITGTNTLLLTLVDGSPQSAVTGTNFTTPFKVRVTNYVGTAQAGVQVTFTAPASGASGKFTTNNQPVYTASSDANGYVIAPSFQANTSVGGYFVVATASGVANSVSFGLTNLVADNKLDYTLKLVPALSGANPLSSTVVLTATLYQHGVVTVTNVPVSLNFSAGEAGWPGAPTYSTNQAANGQWVFTYTRTTTATDSILATATVNGATISSEPSLAYWYDTGNTPRIMQIEGTFYLNGNDQDFIATPASTPLFSVQLPYLGLFGDGGDPYNPDNPAHPPTVVQNYYIDSNGVRTNPYNVEGNGYSLNPWGNNWHPPARIYYVRQFDGVFSGEIVVNKAGTYGFYIKVDDTFRLGIGGGVSLGQLLPGTTCPATVTTGSTPFYKLPIVYGCASLSDNFFELSFPKPGRYPFEIDHTQRYAFDQALIFREFGQTGGPVLTGNQVKLERAGSPATSQVGTPSQTYTVTISDTNGVLITNQNVTITLNTFGNNAQTLTARANAFGQATFVYTGTNHGTDTLQAMAWIRGSLGVSNLLTQTWTPAPGGGGGSGGGGDTNPDKNCTTEYTWVASPVSRAAVSGIVDIKAGEKVSLPSPALVQVYPANQPSYNSVITLTPVAVQVNPSQVITKLDTTLLANGSYIIRVFYTDETGACRSNLTLINVVGENKPGRIAFDVTDFTVPVAGMPIVVGRTYDSLERGTSGDFGYGWNLSISSPKLEVNPAGDVTLTTLDGKRTTFFFTPSSSVFGFGEPGYTAEAGAYGTLTSNGCGTVAAAGSAGGYLCFPGGKYDPNSYTYRDAYGRVYRISRLKQDGSGALRDDAKFKLVSLTDLSGNTLSFDDIGIRASNLTGNVSASNIVTFTRDGSGRISAITGPDGKVYSYTYSANGNLDKVTLPQFMPGSSQNISLTYSYHTTQTASVDYRHLFREAKDPRGNTAAITEYDENGRIAKVTDALGKAYTYDYTFYTSPDSQGATNETVVTNPDGGGTTKTVFDSYGKVLTSTNPLGEATGYRYDPAHNKTRETNALGQTTTFAYNAKGNQTVITSALGFTRTSGYNSYSGPLTMTNEEGERTDVGYNENFMPTSVADQLARPLGGYEFDSRGSVLTRLDGNGKRIGFAYDKFGNKVSETDPLGNASYYAYDNMGRMILMTDTVGTVTKFTYDGIGRQTQVIYAFGTPRAMQVSFEYDSNGNKTVETDNANRKTNYTYDAANRVTRVDYPDGTHAEYTYDWQNNKTSDKLFNKAGVLFRHTQMSYDNSGKLITTTQAASWTNEQVTVARVYDGAGRLISETNPYSGTGYSPNEPGIRYTYDAAGRLVNLKNQLGVSAVYTYDKAGRKVAQTEAVSTPQAYTTGFGYDIRGRMTVITYPNGTTAKSTFDDAGNQLTKIDQGGFTTSYSYDPLNRLLSVTNPASEKVSYRYDAAGRLKAIVDAKTHETGFDYDELGRVTKKTWANGSFEEFGYDGVGNKTSHKLADGNTNTFKYDVMNRVNEVNYFDIATPYLITYTANGLRFQVSDDRGVTTYIYNHRDLLTSYTQPVKDGANFFSQRVDYSYDQAGNRSSVATFMGASSVPSTSVSYGYDWASQLLTVTESGVPTVTTYTYDNLGRRTNATLGNGVGVNFTYDTVSRLTSITQFKSATNIASYTYYYTATNPFGNANLRTGVVETKGNAVTASYAWDYDAAFRVTTETLQAASVLTTTGFGYDGAGNRTEWRQKVGASPTTTVTYQVDELDRLLSTNNGVNGGEVYGYNNRGNLIQIKQNGTVQKSFTWDGADRLVSIAASGSTAATFKYDFDGRRVQQQITTTTATHSLWDVTTRYGDVLLETAYSGATPNAKASYIYANGTVAELLSQKKNGATNPEYFLLDGQGSVRGLTNSNGALVTGSEFSYDTFGKPVGNADLTKSSYLYTGQQYDSISQLYDLRARYYSPMQGRFLSRDTWPVDFQNPRELNRYVYTANNPVNYSDPSGNIEWGFITFNAPIYATTTAFVLAGSVNAMIGLIFLATALCGGYKISTMREAILDTNSSHVILAGTGSGVIVLNTQASTLVIDIASVIILATLLIGVLTWLIVSVMKNSIAAAVVSVMVGTAVAGLAATWGNQVKFKGRLGITYSVFPPGLSTFYI